MNNLRTRLIGMGVLTLMIIVFRMVVGSSGSETRKEGVSVMQEVNAAAQGLINLEEQMR